MSLSPNFSVHLHGRPFEARVDRLGREACVLYIGEPGTAMEVLTIFLPADRLEQVQRIADTLNEIGQPANSKAEAA